MQKIYPVADVKKVECLVKYKHILLVFSAPVILMTMFCMLESRNQNSEVTNRVDEM